MKNIIIILLLIISIQGISQNKRANNWLFGRGSTGSCSWLEFNSDSVVFDNGGALNFREECATISDTSGNLLFYTNGEFVLNAMHDTMPNGFGLLGYSSSANGAIIIPKPLDDNIYYILIY